ncbi:Protein CBG18936 [Caenorhabditis briggsae]|uniref:eRF1 domain-containing protein n=2 Tax=Caenorhabditis briggsae TaxID=6238 RepID=A0AAE9A026_CAEBR|nr:Protein CBG18936 [Caenorhabditis briggsae]ULT90259.1 hypothetical protein L3Y34_008545 [Caenorhabditis briggsae]CAP36265.2 Protein CBG18936 [Caenorhabditis briggsae]
MKNSDGEDILLNLRPDEEKDKTHFTDKESGQDMEIIETMPLLEWFANNYKTFGAALKIVTDKSQEGAQFVRGFGGIGGLLRYRVDLAHVDLEDAFDNIDLDDY